METVSFDTLHDGAIKNTVFELKHLLEKTLQDEVDMDSLEVFEHSSFCEIIVKLNRQYLIEDFADIAEKKLSLNIMYAGNRKDKKEVVLIAYSTPCVDKMYSLILSSEDYGIFDMLCFRIYDSIEMMLYDLQQERKRVSKYNTLEIQDYKTMLNIFIR